MDRLHSLMETMEIMKKFLQKLADSDYDISTREEIIKAGIRKFYQDLARARREGRSIYRSCKEMDEVKTINALVNKPWF